MVRHNLISFNRGIDCVLMSLREAILDEAAKGERLLARNGGSLVSALLRTSDLGVMQIFLEKNAWVVAHLRSLNGESVLQSCFVTMVESELARVLFHAWVAAIKGKIRCSGHFDE